LGPITPSYKKGGDEADPKAPRLSELAEIRRGGTGGSTGGGDWRSRPARVGPPIPPPPPLGPGASPRAQARAATLGVGKGGREERRVLGGYSSLSSRGLSRMRSSMRRMVIAASVANCSAFTLLIAGSRTPFSTLLMMAPL